MKEVKEQIGDIISGICLVILIVIMLFGVSLFQK